MNDHTSQEYTPSTSPRNAIRAVYTDPIIEEYRDNRLISALPPILSLDAAMDQMNVYPAFSPAERNLPGHLRIHCVMRLEKGFFQPVSRHFQLEQMISLMIRQGYKGRNPNGPGYAQRLHDGHAWIEGQVPTHKFHTQSTATSFAIIGESGAGKTTALDQIFSYYPQVIIHEEPNYITQLTWLKIDSPHNGTPRQLAINFFSGVDKALGTNYVQKYATRRSANEMLPYIAQVAQLHCLGTMIIDETQHLNLKRNSQEILNFLVTLVNVIGVPIILVGTMQAIGILQGDFRQARRSSGMGSLVWERFKREVPGDFDEFKCIIEGLWEYQWTQHETLLTDEIVETLYDLSQGIIDIAVKLYMLAQARAITTGIEMLSVQLFRQVSADSFQLVEPMLEAIRSGNPNKLVKYPDITPLNIEEMLLAQSMDLRRGRKSGRTASLNAPLPDYSSDRFAGVRQFLASQDIGADTAKVLLDEVLSEDEDMPPLLVMQKIMSLLTTAQQAVKPDNIGSKEGGGSGTRGKKNFVDLPDDDLRKILSQAQENKVSAYQALLEKGFIKNPFNDRYRVA